MSAPDATLHILAGALAQQVTDLVRKELAGSQQARGAIQPALLTVKEAGVYLGRSEQAIQHLVFQRDLPVVRAGRRVHLDRKDLDAWIEKNKY